MLIAKIIQNELISNFTTFVTKDIYINLDMTYLMKLTKYK